VDVRPASVEDAAAILGLRTAAETWLAERGIEQWDTGEISLADVQGQVAAGEWHVACDAGRVRAALRLLWSDPVWGDDQPAVYVHGPGRRDFDGPWPSAVLLERNIAR
jgi:hypothetical protein